MLSDSIFCVLFGGGTKGSGCHVSTNQSTSFLDNFSRFEALFGSTVRRMKISHTMKQINPVSMKMWCGASSYKVIHQYL